MFNTTSSVFKQGQFLISPISKRVQLKKSSLLNIYSNNYNLQITNISRNNNVSILNNNNNNNKYLKSYYSTKIEKPNINNKLREEEEKEKQEDQNENTDEKKEENKQETKSNDLLGKWHNKLTFLGKICLLLIFGNDCLNSAEKILENSFETENDIHTYQNRDYQTKLRSIYSLGEIPSSFFTERDYFIFSNILAFKLPPILSSSIILSFSQDEMGFNKFVQNDGYKYCLWSLMQPNDYFANEIVQGQPLGLETSKEYKLGFDFLCKTVIESTIGLYQSTGKELPDSLVEYIKKRDLGKLPITPDVPPYTASFKQKPQRFSTEAHDRIAEGVLLGFTYTILRATQKGFKGHFLINAALNAVVVGCITYRGIGLEAKKYNSDSFILRPVDNDLFSKMEIAKTIFFPLLILSRNYWLFPSLISGFIIHNDKDEPSLFSMLRNNSLFRTFSHELENLYDPEKSEGKVVTNKNWYKLEE